MEQQLPAGLSEGQIAEFVEDDEVEAREVIGEPSLPSPIAACQCRPQRETRTVPIISVKTKKIMPTMLPHR